MESVVDNNNIPNSSFWNGRRVFITGHTGFKGAWLSLWLHSLGAKVKGYALTPPTKPSFFELCRIGELVESEIGDIRNFKKLKSAVISFNPEIIIHMAAQPIVRESYLKPVDTYEINVMGTVNLLESARFCPGIKAIVNVTTDKCYDNNEWVWGYRENEPMGGYDPYSSSKACSELVTSAYRNSFFNSDTYGLKHNVALASARAGNVIGGGDWAVDRLLPDIFKSIISGEVVKIRNPNAIRPWQYVFEPLSGYLILAQKLYQEGSEFATSWNFGPEDSDARSVEYIVNSLCTLWADGSSYCLDNGKHPHEASYLKLDCSKAKTMLNWYPKWNIDMALEKSVEWYKAYRDGNDIRELCLTQIQQYIQS